MRTKHQQLRLVVLTVASLNFAYFFVEFNVARAIASVSLFADSIDFLEDAAVNLLILLALGWSASRRSTVGILLAGILLVPGLFTVWQIWQKLSSAMAPDPFLLTITGLGALGVNVLCAFLLARFRATSGSLTKAAWLSARNDAVANVAIVGAGLLTSASLSHWPDLLVGIGILAMNLDAAKNRSMPQQSKSAHLPMSARLDPRSMRCRSTESATAAVCRSRP